PFDKRRLTFRANADRRIVQPRGARADDALAAVVRAERDRGLAGDDGDVGAGVEDDRWAGGKLARTGFDGECDRRRVADGISVGVTDGDNDLAIIGCVGADEGHLVSAKPQAASDSLRRPFWWCDAAELIAIPVPASFRHPRVIDDSFESL